MSSVAEFNRELNAWAAKRLPTEVRDLTKRVALEGFRRIVFRNRVDTGRSRGAWLIEINKPASGEGQPDKNGGSTVADGISRLGALKPFQDVHITNNVEYVSYLEEGSSQQAPAGMVDVTFEELRSIFGR